MESVKVKVQYCSNGGKPNGTTHACVMVRSKTESEISAAIKKRYPKWNFIILQIY